MLRSASCIVTVAAEDRDRRSERHHREREERGDHREHRRDQVDAAGPPSVGVIASLKNSLSPSASVTSTPRGPGAHRPEPRLDVGDHLALHPDVRASRTPAAPANTTTTLRDAGSPQSIAGHASPPAAAAAARRPRAARARHARRRPSVKRAGEQRVRREARLVERHEHRPRRDVRRSRAAGSVASPACRARRGRRAVGEARAAASSGWTSTNAGSSSAALSSSAPSDSRPSSTSSG